jgi:hypothetical protein
MTLKLRSATSYAEGCGRIIFEAFRDIAGSGVSGAERLSISEIQRSRALQFLNCAQLMTTRNWQSASRDSDLACGAPIPPLPTDRDSGGDTQGEGTTI